VLIVAALYFKLSEERRRKKEKMREGEGEEKERRQGAGEELVIQSILFI